MWSIRTAQRHVSPGGSKTQGTHLSTPSPALRLRSGTTSSTTRSKFQSHTAYVRMYRSVRVEFILHSGVGTFIAPPLLARRLQMAFSSPRRLVHLRHPRRRTHRHRHCYRCQFRAAAIFGAPFLAIFCVGWFGVGGV